MEAISNEWTDRLGSIASSVCAVHCALCGLLPIALTTFGLGFLISHEVEWLFSITAILLGLVAAVLGWRQHRSFRVVSVLGIGIVLLLASRGLEAGMGHEAHHDGPEHHDTHGHHDAPQHHDTHGHHDAPTHHDDAAPVGGHGHNDTHSLLEEPLHLAGTLVGVFAGFLLLVGHLLNIRASRRCREECCAPEDQDGLQPRPITSTYPSN